MITFEIVVSLNDGITKRERHYAVPVSVRSKRAFNRVLRELTEKWANATIPMDVVEYREMGEVSDAQPAQN